MFPKVFSATNSISQLKERERIWNCMLYCICISIDICQAGEKGEEFALALASQNLSWSYYWWTLALISRLNLLFLSFVCT